MATRFRQLPAGFPAAPPRIASTAAVQGNADGVAIQDDPFSDVSTKVTPVSPPEAASWSVVIIAAYAVTAGLAYMVVTQIFMQTPEAAAFEAALAVVRQDHRVIVRLGDSIKGACSVGRLCS